MVNPNSTHITFCQLLGARAAPFEEVRDRWFSRVSNFTALNLKCNSPMIDPQVEKLFPKEKKFEQVILTKAIQEGVYTLPPKQRVHP